MGKNNVEEKDILWKDRKRPIFGLPLSFTRYTLTAEKLIVKKGFLNLVTDEIRLYRVLDVSSKESIFQRIFRVGTLKIMSNDESLKNFELSNIKKADFVRSLLSDATEKERVRKRVTSREIDINNNEDDAF